MESYGQFLDINGEKLCINIEGKGNKTIVLLHGAGISSPVLELKPLSVLLSEQYTVITLEYFGYGLSDNTRRERTIEMITEEIHCVLQGLGIFKYSVMAHSISGIYGLYYINKYPDEVEAFIGIDTSVQKQIEFFNTEKLNIFIIRLQRLLKHIGLLSLLSKLKPDLLVAVVKGYNRPAEETELIRTLGIKNITNSNILDELKNSFSNFNKTAGMKFLDIPVLFFLSADTKKLFKQWRELHEEVIEGNTECRIVELEGSHFLYNKFAREIADMTKEFIGT